MTACISSVLTPLLLIPIALLLLLWASVLTFLHRALVLVFLLRALCSLPSTSAMLDPPVHHQPVTSHYEAVLQVVPDTSPSPDSTLLDSLQFEVPDYLHVLLLSTVQDSQLPDHMAIGWRICLLSTLDTFATKPTDLGVLQHPSTRHWHWGYIPNQTVITLSSFSHMSGWGQNSRRNVKTGVIEPSESPWAWTICLVKKKDGTYHFCVDYRRVNSK